MQRLMFLTIALLGSVPSATAQDLGDAGKGLAYARKICAECHAVEAEDRAPKRDTIAAFHTIANEPGMTPRAFSVWFNTPHRDMPNLVIPPGEQDNLIAYFMSLKKK